MGVPGALTLPYKVASAGDEEQGTSAAAALTYEMTGYGGRSGQELMSGIEFKTQEEVVFIRGYIAYDRLVRAPRPTRDGR